VVLAILMPVALLAGTRMALAAQNAAAAPNPDCTLVVPPNPLSAAGLATPYRLVATNAKKGACHESNANQAAFVQGTIADPATGKLSVYNPLVIDNGQKPAVAPVTPQLPAGAVVGLWFGFNGTNLTLRDNRGSLKAGNCVNGLGNSIFGQFAYCNAPAFFQASDAAIAGGKLTVPALGKAKDGQDCPTTRDFSAIDQDQSDNVTSTYLVTGNTAAQNTAANRAKLGRKGKVQVNGSDNLLVDAFIDKALGCTPFKAPDLADNGRLTTALALNELQAAAGQRAPVALVPPNDPMTTVGNKVSVQKTNLYRAGVDQPPLNNAGNLPTTYCKDMVDIQSRRLQQDRTLDSRVTSPDNAAANNLFTFLAQRLNASFTNLGCGKLLKANSPVTVTLKNGVAVDATFGKAAGPTPTASATAGKPNGGTPNGGNNPGNGNGKSRGNKNGVQPSATADPNPTASPGATPVPSATAGSNATASPGATPVPSATAAPDIEPDRNETGDKAEPKPKKY
jgi:hypothetical protein